MGIKIALTLTVLLFALPSGLSAFCYEEAGDAHGINPELLRTISKTESNLNPLAVNINADGSQDLGLMQINSSWIKSMNLDSGLLLSDPCYNLKTGANILNKCFARYGYTWEAIGCYNAVSLHKKVKYSWKIYNILKAEGSKMKNKKQKPELKLQPNRPDSTFFFSVRDASETDMEIR